ncbi:hypothetical protein Ahu01nite_033980 [Winogradskya humida]|uniref:Uncharacterized protein n=1 Tax=Winogradskya humida TaxID=113566 RepID=A0ABQ3ZNY5_9ACTN|nr:hypothetical protein Ahu01nite_033980 [Actinoplanes humidus]
MIFVRVRQHERCQKGSVIRTGGQRLQQQIYDWNLRRVVIIGLRAVVQIDLHQHLIGDYNRRTVARADWPEDRPKIWKNVAHVRLHLRQSDRRAAGH